MDILKILEESGKDLYPEDLEFFETELATGGHYNAAYRAQCMSKIRELKAWISQSSEPTDVKKKSASKGSNRIRIQEAEAGDVVMVSGLSRSCQGQGLGNCPDAREEIRI